jgi:hypothetical protein
VIPRKDLPPIYTMCVPVANQGKGLGTDALEDLHATRKEVVNKVNAARERRVDNMITRLDDSTRVLQASVRWGFGLRGLGVGGRV